MLKSIVSVVVGIIGLAWVYAAFLILVNYLFIFSLQIKPKVEFCREFIHGDSCNLVAYISLWLMELPILLVGLITFSVILKLVSLYVLRFKFSYLFVVSGFVISDFLYAIFGEYGEGNFLFILGTSLFRGLIFIISIWLAKHLTRRSSTAPASPPLDSL
jgi:hypothetical protein